MMHIGLDVGSTTAKLVAVSGMGQILFQVYKRHLSDVKKTALQLLEELRSLFPDAEATMQISGSAGLALAKPMGVSFIQEVVACTDAVERFIPDADVVIELGGEDAKIIYLSGGVEQRMNSACAGGTGAFIDQIAALLQTDAEGLNELAKRYEVLYPIASRCGVFAKTDVQPLLNEGARREDISASIFQSVVAQTIGGLACGRPIRGKVAFLGGPLTFLSELRKRFAETLKLTPENAVFPENAQYFVALGAAFGSRKDEALPLAVWLKRLRQSEFSVSDGSATLPPLFRDADELEDFRTRHREASASRGDLSGYEGPCYLGIDAGSTTTKIVLTGQEDELLYTFYGSNKGNPLQSVIDGMKDLYAQLPMSAYIARSAVTGYGEGLIKAALCADIGEIETVAHYKAAYKFRPDVDLILDIGGQDMKCMKIRNGTIDSVLLNEACSAGCGSFLESFSQALGLEVKEFAEQALLAEHPVDLGSRCTVFMNSKVKQVQKEGATVPDLSAGLSYSVIKNALQKVIKLRNPADLGERVVVQGGTFLNEAVLRAFELQTGANAVRPDIAGIMGAYGCALIARESWQEGEVGSLLSLEELESFTYGVTRRRCGLCGNRCLLTVNKFPQSGTYITGNRCERGAGKEKAVSGIPNLSRYKYDRLFAYESLPSEVAPRGTVGIPRVLNMFENYPLWHTFFTKLGYRVVLSPATDKGLYEKGLESVPSESACYPAKLAHGHIESLLEKGVDLIFYPSVVYEKKEMEEASNHYNCPVVASYPEVIRTNMDGLKERNVPYFNPFVTLDNQKALASELARTFPDIPKKEVLAAVAAAWEEQDAFRAEIRRKGEETLQYLQETGRKGIVLAGRPYHVDPGVNHGIPELIAGYGMAVLTEDSIAHLGHIDHPLRVVNQWTYHARLYRAASYVAEMSNLELVQLTSFGCGLDAVTADMVQEILENQNKMFTLLKIDEIRNLGAPRIRIRSLMAAMKEREGKGVAPHETAKPVERVLFTKEMKQDYTIIGPQMSPIHFELLEKAAQAEGFKLEVLPKVGRQDVDEGLKYVNNDACYPAVLTIGQILAALKSGKYDLTRTAVMMSQTGGGCRATNYISLLRKALKEAGMEQVPVISVSANGIEKHPGMKFTTAFVLRLVAAGAYGDLLMRVLHRVRPYERTEGSADLLFRKWMDICKASLLDFKYSEYKKIARDIVKEFSALPLYEIRKPRVGIVGEILVKFHPDANNQIIAEIEKEGGEAVIPDFLDFMLYCAYNATYKTKQYGTGWKGQTGHLIIAMIERLRKPIKDALQTSGRFRPFHSIYELAAKAKRLLSVGNQTGEGWFLTAEMMELLDDHVFNIVCVQPFACLPNHVVGRGMIKGLKALYPDANIAALDFDAGASSVNQLNRLKLMMAAAFKRLEEELSLAGVESIAHPGADSVPAALPLK
ncbi:2-hydroxyacyl-CoA dehydratase [Gorillibacterium massiliense]|uniref:2-hydroxyacyl-CoA dehydratase n=1 Tax=Gorillibacterium massiliense TaxID=1280390 RepID=UPI00192E3C90|nr:2-hydroxyacyl-CoA dehydratase [Gorillibacterium massiliense]